ncbi:MAG: hypothetical protein R3C03_10505 [Pirellulaceae bacterium]
MSPSLKWLLSIVVLFSVLSGLLVYLIESYGSGPEGSSLEAVAAGLLLSLVAMSAIWSVIGSGTFIGRLGIAIGILIMPNVIVYGYFLITQPKINSPIIGQLFIAELTGVLSFLPISWLLKWRIQNENLPTCKITIRDLLLATGLAAIYSNSLVGTFKKIIEEEAIFGTSPTTSDIAFGMAIFLISVFFVTLLITVPIVHFAFRLDRKNTQVVMSLISIVCFFLVFTSERIGDFVNELLPLLSFVYGLFAQIYFLRNFGFELVSTRTAIQPRIQ